MLFYYCVLCTVQSLAWLLVSGQKQIPFQPSTASTTGTATTTGTASTATTTANDDRNEFFPSFGSRPLCDPILHRSQDQENHAQCLLPLPNNFYLKSTNDTPTGYQVDIPRRALPTTRFRWQFDPADWNQRDGWSASTFIVLCGLSDDILLEWSHVNATDDDGLHGDFSSDRGVGSCTKRSSTTSSFSSTTSSFSSTTSSSKSNSDQERFPPRRKKPSDNGPDLFSFASHAYLPRSTERESPVVLLDAETGERVEHWVMLDHSWAVKYLNPNGPLFDRSDDWMNNNNGTSSFAEHLEMPKRISKEDVRAMESQDWLTETLMIHPARRLKSSHRYIVALRNLRSKTRCHDDGTPVLLEAPEGFRVVRDGTL